MKRESSSVSLARWRSRLAKEQAYSPEFESLDTNGWSAMLRSRRVTSVNHDTVLSLDWPHYCAHATEACGGPDGWCYTFQGKQASAAHNRHAALVDCLAAREPQLFARSVRNEVDKAVVLGRLPYPNLRVAGSGETIDAHLPALTEVTRLGVRLWGFTRNLRLAESLRRAGMAVIVSCDRTSPTGFADRAREANFPLAYTSSGVADPPPEGTLVTFPVHRVGRVREVVDTPTLCPKVLADFLHDSRPAGVCQTQCRRCHLHEETR